MNVFVLNNVTKIKYNIEALSIIYMAVLCQYEYEKHVGVQSSSVLDIFICKGYKHLPKAYLYQYVTNAGVKSE